MHAIRRSLKGDKESKTANQQVLVAQKSATAIVPPKRVIKALYDYEPSPTEPHSLPFHKGDFFHVISREDDADWYEACNPLIPSARGLVPVAYFEIIGKTERKSGSSIKSESTTNTTRSAANARSSASMGKTSGAMVYGKVQYDFNAERPDELEAKADEFIIVIAQSNPEWFVAKPIGRLGGPGLIPVSFIEIFDTATGQPVPDPHEAVQRAGVPRVEEWKRMAAEYKNSSINVGRQDTQPKISLDAGRTSLGNSGFPHPHQSANGYAPYQQPPSRSGASQASYSRQVQQSLPAPVSASLPRYCFDNDMYWYIIECQMEDGQYWELSRYYTDFYDFQIRLLEEFPEEAGNRGLPRTLPFMPGPVAHVTDAISNGRRQNLDEYIRKILSMPPHISRSNLVRSLFAPRHGDFEIDPNAVGEDYRLSRASQHSTLNDPSATASQQSSNGAMNGGAYSGMPPPSSRPFHPRGQPSTSSTAGGGANLGFLQPMNRQASSLTQASGSSGNAGTSSGWVKVKIMFQEELILIRVPSDITYLQLQDKLKDRLKLSQDVLIQYRDDPSNSTLDLNNDTDLDVALQGNPKLTLIVNYAS